VVAVTVSGGDVFVGGRFLTVGGVDRRGLASVSLDQSLLAVGDNPALSEAPLGVAPNPGRAGAEVRYTVARAGRVRLELLDLSGRVVETLADRLHAPGRYTAGGAASRREGLAPGLYIVRLTTPDQVSARKFVVLR